MVVTLERDARPRLAHCPSAPALHRRGRARLHRNERPLIHSALNRIRRRITPPRLELISLHIPKTAGTSFRAALDIEYGHDLAHIYGGAAIDAHRYRAIHGHIRVDEARAVARKAKWIMWLRDPVDRLASYYDFWRQSSPHGNPNHDHFLTSDMDFATFIEWAPIRNEFAEHYVSGLEPDDFTFVGLTERYDDDIQHLAAKLGWRSAPTVRHANVTPTRSTVITDDLRAHIAETHAVETAWYDHFRG